MTGLGYVTPLMASIELAKYLNHPTNERAIDQILDFAAPGEDGGFPRVRSTCFSCTVTSVSTGQTESERGPLRAGLWNWIKTKATAADWEAGDFIVEGFSERAGWLIVHLRGVRVNLADVLNCVSSAGPASSLQETATATATIAEETRAERQLSEAFASGQCPVGEWNKTRFREELFEGRIGGRAFDRAWAKATRSYPERQARGRHPKTALHPPLKPRLNPALKPRT